MKVKHQIKQHRQRKDALFRKLSKRPRTGTFHLLSLSATSLFLSHGVAVSRRHIYNMVAGASTGVLFIILSLAAFGGGIQENIAQAMSDNGVATLAATVSPSLELVMDNSVSLLVTPTAEGQFSRSPLDVYVNTNSTSGYTLTMMSNSGGNGNGALKRNRAVLGNSYYILALSEDKACTDETDATCDNFPSGYWGYRIDGNDNDPYKSIIPFINNATEIKETNTSTGSTGDKTTIYFGSKLDNTTPTGDYSGVSITFAVTTNVFQWSINYHAGNDQVPEDDVKGLSSGMYGTIESDDETGEKKVPLASAPTRTGYAFIGWCAVKPTTTTEESVSGTTDMCPEGSQYSAGQEVTIRINGDSVLDFYAMWTSAKVSVTFNLNTGVKQLDVEGYFGDDMTKQIEHITESSKTLWLAASSTYTLTAEYSTGYRAPAGAAYQATGGVLTGNQFTTGTKNGAVVSALARIRNDLSLTVQFEEFENDSGEMVTGITKVDVYENVVAGDPVATITSSGGSTGNKLTYGYNYYLVPTFDSGYAIASWSYGTPQLGGEVVGTLHTNTDTCGTVTSAWYTVSDGENVADLAAQEMITIAANTTMQNLAGEKSRLIQSMETGKAYPVIDTRNGGTTYNIAKLADCNIWLLDNLRLGDSTAITLTHNDTNLESDTVTKTGTGSFELPASGTANFSNASASYTTAAINTSKKDTASTGGSYRGTIGVFYNYCAASAGTYCYADNNNGDNNHDKVNASYDICPKGWRMPTGGAVNKETGAGEYQALRNAYSSDAAFIQALHVPLSGYFRDGSAGNQGSYGYFWSSTYGSATYMYGLYLDGSTAYPQNDNVRYYGFSVRCVLK